MAHRVGIIGGDGIGPEVTAEALKVVRAAGVALDTTDYDLGGAPLPRDRRGAARLGARGAARASTRSCSARSARPKCRPACSSAACC